MTPARASALCLAALLALLAAPAVHADAADD